MILTSITRAVELREERYENNPFLTGANLTGTYSTTTGTEVSSAAKLGTYTTYDRWTATVNGSGVAVAQVDLGSAQTVSFAAIARHTITDAGGLVELQRSADGVTWYGVMSGTGTGVATPEDNEAVAWRFSAISARYWRIRITGATGNVSVAVLWLGAEIIIPQRIYQGFTPAITPTDIELQTAISEGGELLASVAKERGSSLTATFEHISDDFIRSATWKAFQRHYNTGKPTFFGWRPDKYGDLWYMQRGSTSAIVPTNSGPLALMSFTVAGRAIHG